ncbi:MAG: hypothetical protein Kow00129_16460 [Thermoleophilia bacterium]
MHDWWWGTGVGWFGFFFMLLFWALIIVGVIFLIRALSSSQGRSQSGGEPMRGPEGSPPAGTARPASRALELLEERYARGEIDREEFLQRKKDLLGS